MFDNKDIKEVKVLHPAKKDSPKYPAVEGIELKKIYKEESKPDAKNPYKALVFRFENSLGEILDHKEFEPSKGPQQTDEKFLDSVKLSVSRIAHISRAFLTEAEFLAINTTGITEPVAAWRDYVVKTIRALLVSPDGIVGKAMGIKNDLKVVYRSQGGKYYSSLPAVPPFISNANHPKTLSVNPQYDIMEVPSAKPDAEKPKSAQGGYDAPIADQAAPPLQPVSEPPPPVAKTDW